MIFGTSMWRAVVATAWVASMPLQALSQTTAPSTPASVSAPIVEVSEVSAIAKPVVAARAWILVDAVTGQTIAAQNPEQSVEPASLTKIMTVYMAFDALKENRITREQQVSVSEKAWKTPGSRMFIEPRKPVTVDEIIQGIVVQSGNDASVALAETLAGTEEAFAQQMTQTARDLGMTDTTFKNASGLPDPQHITTVRDLAILAQRMIADHPDKYQVYSQREFTYNNIKQANRNRLLWADPSVDGMKTGHTEAAGYCLISTAQRGERRVISVLVGAESESTRAEESLKLLNWAFQNFDTVKLVDAGKAAIEARVWEGTTQTASLGTTDAIWLTIPRGKTGDVQLVAQRPDPLIAPLEAGQRVGTLTLTVDGKPLRTLPLDVLTSVEQAGFFGRAIDQLKLWLQ
ncbi:MAG: D-alanyl-D-alanine carboxypeptidase [Burkholderiaceae bacterium]|nr:D-alanyl-D-alanine carboxypeptidase [Burkholderiaceae bacterium]MCD8517906.1 D-alanyl-D-alanine carboxypeptidase [Burkholderiaceae bacterium]MCD8536524.1 D-alanyl-D-alanine carboxypeptidase [Burkholderiaceae bacterium]MCD8565354.1 D-alanyl-D-alanine carboxypeptidase [Burkholderiaceae bacterium]